MPRRPRRSSSASSAGNSRGRSRRRRSTNNAPTSIRDGSRIRSLSQNQRNNRRYSLQQSRRGEAAENEQDESQDESDSVATADIPRHCYCDIACRRCHGADTDACPEHAGLDCSACHRRFHAKCIGGTMAADQSYIKLTGDDGMTFNITLDALTQDTTDDNPWYCINCWEAHKTIDNRPFSALTNSESDLNQKAQRLGYDRDDPPDCKPVPNRQNFAMYNEETYRPENARGHAQMLYIGMVLVMMKWWLAYFEETSGQDDPAFIDSVIPPPSVTCYIQGNPGTGKSFLIHTARNMVCNLTKSMQTVINCAPTGCAAALIEGQTNSRCLKIPCSKKTLNGTIDSALKGSVLQQQAFMEQWMSCLLLQLDEHSMTSRPAFAWMEDRCRTCRQSCNNISADVKERLFGGIPIVSSFGDCHQLPAVAATNHFDQSRSNKPPDAADNLGRLVVNKFLRSHNLSETISLVIVMDVTVRQDEEEYKTTIQQLRDGTVDDATADLLLSRRLSQLPEEVQKLFWSTALFLVPTWRDTIPIIRQYLIENAKPVVRVDAKYGHPAGRVNHALKDCKLPKLNALAVGARVILLTNYVVEWGFFNGAVGTVIRIYYANRAGPRENGAQPLSVIVDFPYTCMPLAKVWDVANPTHVPIPVIVQRCDRDCCTMSTIPLRICKAITIHKAQGATVGPGHFWERLVMQMPPKTSPISKTPGLAQVGFSRTAKLENLAIRDPTDNPFTVEQIKSVGTGPAYASRRDFEMKLRSMQEDSQRVICDMIIAETPLGEDEPTFERGLQALIAWYRECTMILEQN